MSFLLLALFALVGQTTDVTRRGILRHARLGLAVLLLAAVVIDPSGRALITTVRTGSTISPVVEAPGSRVTQDAIDENVSTVDPGGAGQFFQQLQAQGEWFRFVGYEPALQSRNKSDYPQFYREHYANPLALDLLINARAMRLEIFDAQGYNPVQLTTYTNFLNRVNQRTQDYHDAQILPNGIDSPLLNLLNVRYIVIPNYVGPGMILPHMAAVMSRYPEVFRNEQIRVLENPDAMPRAWIVHEINRVDSDRMPRMLRTGEIDPRTTLLLDRDVPEMVGIPLEAGQAATERVEILSYEPDAIKLNVQMSQAGALVLSETYDPGWTATVNGTAVPIYRAYSVIRAIGLQPGESVVELRYEPRTLYLSFYVSGAFLVAALGVATLCLWRRWTLRQSYRA